MNATLSCIILTSEVNPILRQVSETVQSDRKKLYPFEKASRLPDLKKDGSVQQTLQVGQEVLVQIVKETISTRVPVSPAN
jgi:ribonuclease G